MDLARMEMEKQRTLLLVDDEENILSSLKRLLRRDGYNIITATGAREGLELLERYPVGVILSDMRMPEMNGVEFLSKVKERFPDVVRIMLSGYSDLRSITESINKGEIYKFLTKPWEDDLMRTNIRDAFEHVELDRENKRLATELQNINRDLEQRVEQKAEEAEQSLHIIQLAQGILEHLPVGVICVGEDGIIANGNLMAHKLLAKDGTSLLGMDMEDVLQPELIGLIENSRDIEEGSNTYLTDEKQTIVITHCNFMDESNAKRILLVIIPSQEFVS